MNPSTLIKTGNDHLNKARDLFESAVKLYDERNDPDWADKENSVNVTAAIEAIDTAIDKVSEIVENDC